ncbi:MAG TPA: baseplate J/gp47 family protein [Sphingobium sp.]|uniref:baseplate J/gp47 family protein n=1 Tax=Sphingobium sp. TaxID=1912891 RepID=UPI002ED5EBE7
MPYPRPTLTQLRAEVSSDINGASDPSSPLLRYSNLRIAGEVQAGVTLGLYGYLDYIAKQATPFTATDEYLEGWAALKDVLRKAATSATGFMMVTGAEGKPIPAGSQVTRGDGTLYTIDAEASIVSGTATVAITAVATGAAGNAAAATTLTFTSPIEGVTSSGSALGPITGGDEVEGNDSLRSRMLERFAAPAQGGNATDYELWARAVAGVTRAWTRPHQMGVGTVTVFFMMDDAQAANGGFPQGTNGVAADETRDFAATGDQLTVANSVFEEQPVTPIVYYAAPGANAINLTISGVSTATSDQKALIGAGVRSLLVQFGEPGGLMPTILIEGAIAAVTGTAPAILMGVTCNHGSVSPGSAGNVQSSPGYIPTLGGITFV